MSDLTITATDVAPVEIFEQWTGPAIEAFSAGEMVRIDTGTGKVTPANATAAAEARTMGMAISTGDYIGDSVTVVKRGVIDVGDALDALDYDAAIYLSNTDGTLGTAAATTSLIVGRVVPAWGSTTADKLLHLDVRADL